MNTSNTTQSDSKDKTSSESVSFYKRKSFWLAIVGAGCVALGGPIPSCLALAIGG